MSTHCLCISCGLPFSLSWKSGSPSMFLSTSNDSDQNVSGIANSFHANHILNHSCPSFFSHSRFGSAGWGLADAVGGKSTHLNQDCFLSQPTLVSLSPVSFGSCR